MHTTSSFTGDWVTDIIEFLTTGDSIALEKLEHRDHYPESNIYQVHLARKVGDLCDTLGDSKMLDRLARLLKSDKAAYALTNLLNKDFLEEEKSKEFRSLTTRSSSRLLFWGALIITNERIRYGLVTCRPLNAVRREWVYSTILKRPEAAARQRVLRAHDINDEAQEATIRELWSQIKIWLTRHDQHFYEAVMFGSQMLNTMNSQAFTDFANKYPCDLRGNSTTAAAMRRQIMLYTEGVSRGFLEPSPSSLTYEWFLASDKPVKHPSVAQAIRESFETLSECEGKALSGVLRSLTFYPPMAQLLPMFEVKPAFAEALGHLPPKFGAKIIEQCSMRDQWLNQYPKFAEDLFIREIGL